MSDFLVRHNPDEDIVHVEMRGEFDAKLLSASTAAFVEEVRRTSSKRVLMDHRQATPRLTVPEQYDRPEIASELGVPRSCRLAIVCRETDEVYRFIETVGVNRGFIVKVFTNIEEAVDWLKGTSEG